MALHDSVTGWAFGPVFNSEAEADDFLEFTKDSLDLRMLTDDQMMKLYKRWCALRAERGHGDE